MFILFLGFMSFEYFIQLTIAIFMVLVTVIIAVNNHKLTNNNEKFSHGHLIVDFQDKLSSAILSEQNLIKKWDEYCIRDNDEEIFFTPETDGLLENYIVNYLNLVNSIAYLFTMEKSMLEYHKNYFEFYIAYGKKLLDVKSIKSNNNQSEYWQYIEQCVSKYNMETKKSIPFVIGIHYDQNNESKWK